LMIIADDTIISYEMLDFTAACLYQSTFPT